MNVHVFGGRIVPEDELSTLFHAVPTGWFFSISELCIFLITGTDNPTWMQIKNAPRRQNQAKILYPNSSSFEANTSKLSTAMFLSMI